MTAATSTRICPICGNRQTGLRCARDGAVTVERPEDEPRARLPVEPGVELDGRYAVGAVIGRGAFGAVYAAEQLATGQRVAIKVLLAAPQGDRRVAEERFRKEARVLGQLRHPATVRVYDVGMTPSGDPYFAMELVEGPNLEQVLASLRSEGHCFGEAEIIDVISPVLGSLAEAHGLGLVHRDLKPANIMLSQVADDGMVVKVLDFGVVRTEGSQLTGRASGLGTPRYMSPEQCRGEGVDARSDLYSIGCILYEALCGIVPFATRNAIETMYAQMMSPVPPLRSRGAVASDAMIALVERALSKDPEQRFATASEMRAALDSLRRTQFRDVPPARLLDIFHDEVEISPDGAHSVFVSQQNTVAIPRQGTSSVSLPMGLRDTPLEPARAPSDVTAIDLRPSLPPDEELDSPALSQPPAHRASPTARNSDRHTQDDVFAAGSQGLVRLPSPRVLEAAIEARQRALAARDAARHEVDTRLELGEERAREAQQAPPGADDVAGRSRKALGSSTIIGTGVPGKPPKGSDQE